MNCERAIELILDAFVEPLAAEDRAELDKHLAECESCAAEAAEYRAMFERLDAVALPARRPGGLDRLQAAISTEPRPVSRPAWLKIAAAIALFVAGGLIAIGVQTYLDAESRDVAVEDTRARFLFVMTETTEDPELTARANEEIQAWFSGLIEAGILEVDTAVGIGAAIGTPPEGPLLYGPVSGMVVIRAADEQEARRIAVSSPIIEYGGFIEIRAVD